MFVPVMLILLFLQQSNNLGGFDGIFILKYLVKLYNKKLITSIIDDKNKVISIAYKSMDNSITFKDSYRIFPIKLDDLCQIFKVSNKIINIGGGEIIKLYLK